MNAMILKWLMGLGVWIFERVYDFVDNNDDGKIDKDELRGSLSLLVEKFDEIKEHFKK